jgi:endonuclease/exonuclease/phosphatase (EEP) superfamily protein YafD
VLSSWLVLRFGADRWWPATILLFGPRWILALPLLVLIPATVFLARRAVWLLVVCLVFILGPLAGFSVPWRVYAASEEPGISIRVLSFNVHFNKLDVSALSELIEQTQPDVVALQGWLGKYNNVLSAQEDWHARREGELFLASRFPIAMAVVASDPMFGGSHGALAHYELDIHGRTIHLINLHLASPRQGLNAAVFQPRAAPDLLRSNSALRRDQAMFVTNWTRDMDGPLLIVGDFNTPPDSTIYHYYWSPFHNGFEEGSFGWGHTYISRWGAVRIDHQLAGPGWHCQKCRVGPEVGSPHRPVIADWEWKDPFGEVRRP